MSRQVNASDPRQVKERVDRETLDREQELNDIRALMHDEWGRRMMWRLLEMAGVYRSSFDASNNRICFNEGRRDVGLHLLADVDEACPEAMVLMSKEAKLRETKNA